MLKKPYKTLKDGLKIFGNNHEIPTIYGYELTDEEKKEFDYHTQDELECTSFFRYKNNVYDLSQFSNINNFPELKDIADGIVNDTFFSGILVKYCDDMEFVKVYTFYS